jgi:hypothetical protein
MPIALQKSLVMSEVFKMSDLELVPCRDIRKQNPDLELSTNQLNDQVESTVFRRIVNPKICSLSLPAHAGVSLNTHPSDTDTMIRVFLNASLM